MLYYTSTNHPEIKKGEVFLCNIYPHEKWSTPPFCKSIRKGKIAYDTNGKNIRDFGLVPLFGVKN